jgi:hypothetical protein
MPSLIYVLIAVLTFLLGIIAALITAIYSGLNGRVESNAVLLADNHDDIKVLAADMKAIRGAFADHLRSSRRLQGEYAKTHLALDRRLRAGGH